MKKIKLLVGRDLYTDGLRVLKKNKVFFDPIPKRGFKRFSLLIPYARNFNIRKVKEITEVYCFPYVSDVIIIVGSEGDKEKVKSEMKLLYGKVAINVNYSSTVYSSLKIGLKAISRDSSFIILHFGTLGKIKSETASILMESALRSGKGIIIPTFNGKRGHPIIFSKKLLSLFMSLRKEKGLPYILKNFRNNIMEVGVTDEQILKGRE